MPTLHPNLFLYPVALLAVLLLLPFTDIHARVWPTDSIRTDTLPPVGDTLASAVGISILPDTLHTSVVLPSSAKPTFVVVNSITITGNKRTKRPVILRELDFSPGDTLKLADLETIFTANRNQVYNTRLFNEVKLVVDTLNNQQLDVRIEVEERWYIFPAPIFELADRNFNEWWNKYDRDLSRTQYGLFFFHENFRGRRETLKFLAHFGYTKKFEISYNIPFIEPTHKWGLNPFIGYVNNKEIAYRTVNNELVQFRDDDRLMRTRLRAGVNVSYRPDIEATHELNVSYLHNTIADTVAALNPHYFLDGRTREYYFQLVYTYTDDHRDIRAYPLSGYFFRFQAAKLGIGLASNIDVTSVEANYTRYVPLGGRFYGLGNVHGQLSWPARQPYFNLQGSQGFGINYLRGYEYAVIDGQQSGMLRTAVKYQLFNLKFKNPLIKAKQFRTIPFALYLKTYGELGYVRDDYYAETNSLSNTVLGSTGAGIDICLLYDWVASFEYSFTRQGHQGFFVSFALNYD